MKDKKNIQKELIVVLKKLFFSYPQIVLQEVPDEISLALSISGCPLKCIGCHSSFTWKSDFGEELTDERLEGLIQKNHHISCILFYGGEWVPERLLELFKICKSMGKKICLYTGLEHDKIDSRIIEYLSFLKTGRYIKELGNLSNKNTNQRFYKIPTMEDITYKFWK